MDFLGLGDGTVRFPETSVWNYLCTLRNNPEERGSHVHRGVSVVFTPTVDKLQQPAQFDFQLMSYTGVEVSSVTACCRLLSETVRAAL